MSICPRLGVEVPELTARVARASNPSGTTAMWVRDRLDGRWDDEDFADWYPRDRRPGIRDQRPPAAFQDYLGQHGHDGVCALAWIQKAIMPVACGLWVDTSIARSLVSAGVGGMSSALGSGRLRSRVPLSDLNRHRRLFRLSLAASGPGRRSDRGHDRHRRLRSSLKVII